MCASGNAIDDWVILITTQWKLRKSVKIVNQVLKKLKLEKYSDKTYMGKIEKGFNFLGYKVEASGLQLAPKSLERFSKGRVQLYEQGADDLPIEQYIRHFINWSKASVGKELS